MDFKNLKKKIQEPKFGDFCQIFVIYKKIHTKLCGLASRSGGRAVWKSVGEEVLAALPVSGWCGVEEEGRGGEGWTVQATTEEAWFWRELEETGNMN
jgi:hypothetical protein